MRGSAHDQVQEKNQRNSDSEGPVTSMTDEEMYKYLGIAQVFAPATVKAKHKLRRKFLGRLRAPTYVNARQ